MDWTINVAVHESASPEFLREQILSALQEGRVHPHLLYSGLRQTELWIALHQAFSPARHDSNCVEMYNTAFARAAENIKGNVAHIVSLACGDGTKDVRCLERVRRSDRAALYTPVDISLEMVLTATRAAMAAFRGLQSTPLVCDLAHCSVLPAILKGFDPSGAERVLLFLGTIHNYWPPEILRSVFYPLRSQDQLLVSANLVPAETYDDSLREVLQQYDNEPTRRWLMGALSEFGLTESDGQLRIGIHPSSLPSLKRIEAIFHLNQDRAVRVLGRELPLKAGEQLSVFYSHRFTLDHLRHFFGEAGLSITETWVGAGGYEALFLCKRAQ
jgi:L-histidine N-alpha-methyltransferase